MMPIPGDPDLYLCTWGSVRIWGTEISWQDGNTVVVHDPAAGNVHPISVRGERIRTARITLSFDDFEGESVVGLAAYRRLEASKSERRVFTHPMSGSYFARIGALEPKFSADGTLSAEMEVIPDGEIIPVIPASAGTTTTAGETATAAAADRMADTLSDARLGFPRDKLRSFDFNRSIEVNIKTAFSANVSAGVSANVSASASASASATATAGVTATATAISSASALAFASAYEAALAVARTTDVVQASAMAGVGAFALAYAAAALDTDVRTSVTGWNQDKPPMRQVLVDVSRISDSIVAMIDTGNFKRDLQLFPAYKAAIMLGGAVRSSAISATMDTRQAFVMRIESSKSVMRLAADVYGGSEAQERARQIMSMNDIATPAWIAPGRYLMPARTRP